MKIKRQRKRPQWHADFKKEHGRCPNQFEVFMRTYFEKMNQLSRPNTSSGKKEVS
jgi:hypothetical protein